jgi:hypothetical protein
VTNGDAALPPSWEQLLTGTHPCFRDPASVQGGGRGPARHGRGDCRTDDQPLDPLDDLDPWVDDEDLPWADAVLWTVAAGGVALLLASRMGVLLH